LRSSYLVLDEPTAMLDPRGRKEVMDIVKKLNQEENITIIYITHLMEEAANRGFKTIEIGCSPNNRTRPKIK